VWGHTELTTTVEVRPDGMITFPLVGDRQAVGRSTQELASDIQEALREYVIEPHVTVLVSQFRTVGVQVLGEVKSPGYYLVRANARLMDALGLAGGPTRAADLSQVVLTRRSPSGSAEIQRINVTEYIQQGNLAANPILEPGDVIQVDAVGKALILGEVRQPASYDIGAEMDILDLLGLAGGALDSADLEQVVLTRTYEGGATREMVINVQSLLAGRTEDAPRIQRNDVVFVPAKQQVIVLGAVRSPGTYPLKKGARLLDIVAAAGGLTDAADSHSIAVTRSALGEQEVFTVDAHNALMGRVGGDNPALMGGDIVFVREAKSTALVLGQVVRPGSYPVTEHSRVLDVIAAAGGLTAQAAAERVTLTRTTAEEVQLLEMDITLVQQGRQENLAVQPGDVLFVPEGAPQVLVLGQVRSPGSYRVTESTRLLDVLAMAGGTLDRAGQKLTLTRAGETKEIDLGALMRLGLGNERVQAGDVIHIPEGQQQVLVLGQVRSPGYYRFSLGDRVLDAVGYAGGLLPDAAAEDVTLTRQNDGQAEIISLNLEELMENRFLTNNLPLQAGDIIIVPKANRTVLVLGEVRSPGYYTITGRERVLDLLAMAGGLTEEALGEEVTVTRRNADGSEEILTVNADAAMRGESRLDAGDNPVVAGGDVIFVPERQTPRVLVFGEVRSPGYYTVDSRTRLLDVIAKAGGLLQSADETSVVLTREVDGTVATEEIDVGRAMLTGEGNYLLSGGETVSVPRVNRTVVVFGEVARPGSYPVEPGDRLTDILAKAGGPLETADLSQVAFTTRSGEAGSGVSVIDLGPALVDANHHANLPVTGGETIHIPATNRRVLVLGQVQRPGAYTIDRYTRLLDLLAMAGGPTATAELSEATLTRSIPGGEEVKQIDLREVIANQADNLELQGGDILYLPPARQVLVMGEVNRAGAYTLPPGGRILDILALAGGLKSSYAEQEIIMTRQDGDIERVWHMYYGELMAAQAENNLLLTGGDVVYVPEVRRQVLVLGEVRSPGVYSIPTGARVLDAIALAGGPTDRAALENVGIYRGGSTGDPTTLTMGKDKLLFEGNVEENPLIQGGDVIYVPETTKPNWTSIFSFIGGLKTFNDLISSFRSFR